LSALARHRRSPRGIVLRIEIVLGAAEGLANRVLARRLYTSVPTVLLWRKRFESDGIAGILEDRPRSRRPKRISAEQEAAIVEATMKTTPKDATAVEPGRNGDGAPGEFRHGAAHLEEIQTATASRGEIQTLQRSAVCAEGSRHCKAVYEANPIKRSF